MALLVCLCLQIKQSRDMPFSSLHIIEMQLCMQFCDAKSFIAFARCCRTSVHAASSVFASSFLPPLALPARPNLGSLLNASLWRFRPISLLYPASNSGNYRQCHADFIEAAVTVAHLRQIDLSRSISVCDLTHLLAHPNLRSIVALTIDGYGVEPAHMSLLASLPRLRTLHNVNIPLSIQSTECLRQLPQLTELQIVNFMRDITPAHADHIAGCVKLTAIALPHWPISHCTRLLAAPRFGAQLQRLMLMDMNLSPPNHSAPEVWSELCSSLVLLRTLIVTDCNSVEELVTAAVTRCPALALLRVRPMLPSPDMVMGLEPCTDEVGSPEQWKAAMAQRQAWAESAETGAVRPLVVQLRCKQQEVMKCWAAFRQRYVCLESLHLSHARFERTE